MCPRKRHIARRPSVSIARQASESRRRRLRASGSSRVREPMPFAGAGLARWDRRRCSTPRGAAPGSAGVSIRRCHGLTTRGVRADRVGVALSLLCRKAGRAAERQPGEKQRQRKLPPTTVGCGFGCKRPLARETSAGGRRCRWSGASASVYGDRWCCPCSVQGRRRLARLRPCRSAHPSARRDGGASASPPRSGCRRARRAGRASAR
jgi:hypothetical protein